MKKSLSHTRADRALEQFRHSIMIGVEHGVLHQHIGDVDFRGDRMILQGREVANFGLCCYLGLSDDPRLTKAAKEALDHYGNSYSSSIAYTSVPLYRDLDERFEQIFGAPVIIAASTTLSHLAALPVLIRPRDLVVVDGQAHASILAITPTLQVNGSRIETMRHNDLGALERMIEEADGRTVWYLTDGVFSMHGDTLDAEALMGMLRRHENLHVYCDDAHGFGWDGEHGRGNVLRRIGWHERLVISVGLAKSFGTMGGVVATPNRDLIDMISTTAGHSSSPVRSPRPPWERVSLRQTSTSRPSWTSCKPRSTRGSDSSTSSPPRSA
jgi:7-keto-8-aminopelargonate synthetase-like enzyme